VRENIIFDKPYEAAWYKAVLDATALGTDVGAFEEGDRRVVSGLSGGQKQRYVRTILELYSCSYEGTWEAVRLWCAPSARLGG
jgi:hypothetical protein